jgi:hypothetical protein
MLTRSACWGSPLEGWLRYIIRDCKSQCGHQQCVSSASVLQWLVSCKFQASDDYNLLTNIHALSMHRKENTSYTCESQIKYPEANKYSTCSGSEGKQLGNNLLCLPVIHPMHQAYRTSAARSKHGQQCRLLKKQEAGAATQLPHGPLVLMIHVNNAAKDTQLSCILVY